MRFLATEIRDVWGIEPEPRADERGYFARVFCRREFEAHDLNANFVQCNVAFNPRRGTLRGLHFQADPRAECKLVRCVRGSVFDVAVDLRADSPTFGRSAARELSAARGEMLYIPEGFAHGYLTLENASEVFYQVTREYSPQSELGLRWNDPTVGVAWPFPPTLISEKDRSLPDLATLLEHSLGKGR